MARLADISTWCSIVAGFFAAWLWYKASTVVITMDDPRSDGGYFYNDEDIYATSKESGKFNKWAAMVTALAVFLQAAGTLATKFVGSPDLIPTLLASSH